MSAEQPLYTRDILRLAGMAPAHGLIDGQPVAKARSKTCGSRIELTVTTDQNGRIARIGQRLEACAFGQASAALMALGAPGRTAAEVRTALAALAAWLDGRSETPGDWPGLAALEPARARTARHGAILMPFEALAAALVPVSAPDAAQAAAR